MIIYLIIAGSAAVAALVFVIYRSRKVKGQIRKLVDQRFERIRPLYTKLEHAEIISPDDVLPFAKNVMTREATFQLLYDFQKLELFPREYLTIVKSAESNLANWLEFPTELAACPDELEHIKRVSIDFDGQRNFVHYEVFKYKVNAPHWAAKEGWMLGVVGPYFDHSKPYDFPHATFSRTGSTVDKVSADEEATWVHENILNVEG
ncbi:hypothetical protein [Pinibacter soli]|uniref:Uncharacterized protein n=1 Tax=Pinibacter soli TaxID=3044211 RepID=A0ABT6RCP3_9BACT|nr:hypothetical protein [Pinibacter soli]MDI3320333.1 hypothetical protein [Pinibacter soli]